LLYYRHVMPRAARLISGDRSGAYDYLPQSVTSFLDEKGMIAALWSAGFARVEARRLTFGVVTVYIAWK
jgi:demethylmenaquinone methyltransferase/2-methoxy-6-polyprenyl-1,4-benzoquinol methylase